MKTVLLLCVAFALAQTGTAQNGAQVLSVSAPAAVAPGATFTATITMKNTGGTTWTSAALYNLGSESPRNNLRWLFNGRVALPADPIFPGDTAAFTTTFTAPTAPGVYSFGWSMVQDLVEWFGQIASSTIRVGNGQFTPGDLVVTELVTTAADSGVNTAGTGLALKNISLPSGATTFEVDLPITGPDAMVTGGNPFTGMIDLSTDGNYLIVAGYNTNAPYRPAGANVSVEAAGSPISRVVGTVNSAGQYLLRASTTPPVGFTGGTLRGAVSDGRNNFWAGAQNSGIYYFGNNFPPKQISTLGTGTGTGAIRDLIMVNGRPFFSTSQFPAPLNYGVAGFPSVAPTSPEEPALLIDSGNAVTGATTTPNPKGFCISPDFSIAYVVDLRTAPNGGIYRYDGTGTGLAGSWTYAYTIAHPSGGAFQEVVADFSGIVPILYATAGAAATGNAAGNTLVTAPDTGFPGTLTFTTLATAASGVGFRGLTFAPKLVSLSIARSGADVVITWNGGGALRSAGDVTGPYVPVAGSPTSPYTTPASGAAQFYTVGFP